MLAPTTVVTRQDIDRWQSTSVNDVLRRLPGVDITQNGGSGQLSSIFIRGTNASHVLVLIDGVRLNLAGVSGSADLSQFPIALVQRVEYIRGPRSAVYGSDAIGGVVNIITTRDEPGTEISAGWGSNSYQNYDVSTQQQLGLPTLPNISRSFIASPKAMQSRNDKPKCWVSTVNAAPLLQPTGSTSRQSVAEKHKCARSPNASYSLTEQLYDFDHNEKECLILMKFSHRKRSGINILHSRAK